MLPLTDDFLLILHHGSKIDAHSLECVCKVTTNESFQTEDPEEGTERSESRDSKPFVSTAQRPFLEVLWFPLAVLTSPSGECLELHDGK